MNNLEKLISELCPNGVEYKSIKRCVLNIEKINWKEHSGKLYKYIDLTSVDRDTHQILETQEIQAENAPSRAQQIVRSGDILLGATRPMLKRYCIVPDEYNGEICSTGFCVLRPDEKYILGRWLYHIISSTEFFGHVEKFQKGASYPAISAADVKLFSMPVPPLEVQCEIVRILDNFTKLTAKLTAELSARKKQYEYYRNKFLTFDNVKIQYYSLKDICEIVDYRGKTPKKVENGVFLVTAKNIRRGYIDYEMSKEYVSKDEYMKVMHRGLPQIGDVLITTEAPCGNVAMIDREDIALAQRVIKYRPKNFKFLDCGYLKHILLGKEFQEKLVKSVTGGTVKGIKGSKLHQLTIPVPPLDVQKSIVNILDNFETICTDINIGLPAEIEARQKQYEYYRDKLLTFKELNE